jgi:hypothetical protein
MHRIAILIAVICLIGAAEEKPEPKSPASVLVDKAIAENSKDAEKAYLAYQKALEAANSKVLKALEVAKKDLNDPTKGKMSIAERAKALEELDGKMKAIKEGLVGAVIVEKCDAKEDLLGNTEKRLDSKSNLVGRWLAFDQEGKSRGDYVFNKDGTGMCWNNWKIRWVWISKNTYRITFDTEPSYTRICKVITPEKEAEITIGNTINRLTFAPQEEAAK